MIESLVFISQPLDHMKDFYMHSQFRKVTAEFHDVLV